MSDNTYLGLVNAVLVRLREDTVTTVNSTDDVVVELVKAFVNDAKRVVEDSHTWSSLQTEWNVSTTIGNDRLVLTNSRKSPIIDYILDSSGNYLTLQPKEYLRRKSAQSGSTTGTPTDYIVDGVETNGDLRLRIWPAPAEVKSYTVYGFHRSGELVNDTDVCVVPTKPVIYLAEAFAARERGEVGGQSSGELMNIAQQYLRDSIAMDAVNSDPDNIWYTV